MGPTRGPVGYDGTTGKSGHGGRRTHIIQVLRDSKEPVSVARVAREVNIHVNTARFHLESLVDAGMAVRTQEPRETPGRPKILYTGTLPNQTHERAQGYRLLAEMLTTTVAQHVDDAESVAYEVGRTWGRYLTSAPAPFETLDEHEVGERLIEKMDALWFAPEMSSECPGDEQSTLSMHNCPFLAASERHPGVVCSLHAGLINGSLEELNSVRRAVELRPFAEPHRCVAILGAASGVAPGPIPVVLNT